MVGEVTATVTDADTAEALGSGDVAVLGTPRVIALLEAAAMVAVDPHLAEGQTTVGLHIELEHMLAEPVGAVVTAEARLADVDGRRLTFIVRMEDDQGRLVASGRVRRAVVERQRFLDAAHHGRQSDSS